MTGFMKVNSGNWNVMEITQVDNQSDSADEISD